MSERPPSSTRRADRRRGPAGFDRIKAPGSRPRDDRGEAAADREGGRAALFGAADGPAPGAAPSPPRRALPVAAVHCRACEATSPLDVLTALRGMLPLVVVPWADHPWWAPCPACGRRSWLRPEVLGGEQP